MSFVIITADNEEFTWHVNQVKPNLNFVFPASRIAFLQADGHELEYIGKRFDNLPYAHAICKWRNEMAQFIYDNL